MNLTLRDQNQINRHEHNEEFNARRVVIVGGSDININADSDKIADSISSALKESFANLKQPEVIEKYIVVKEPQIIEIEKQIIVKEKELIYVDKPVIVEKIVYREIEKPVIVASPTASPNKFNHIILACFTLQTVIIMGLIVLKI